MPDILPEQVTGRHIRADLDEGVYTLLVDVKPGSVLDNRLTELERKIDHIFALLVAAPPRT